MSRRTFFLIVIGGGILIIIAIIFLIATNPYERFNPPATEEEIVEEVSGPPLAEDAPEQELVTVWEGPTTGATIGIDGERLLFLDAETSEITVTEADGTGVQSLSDAFVNVLGFAAAPTKDKAWVQLNDPDATTNITLIYEFKSQEAIRLEDGITAIDFSPDGSRVVYYVAKENAAPLLRVATSSGGAPTTLRENFVLQNPVLDWFADDQMAFWLEPTNQRPSSVIMLSISGTETLELSPEAGANQALFSPDGKQVLLSQNNGATNQPLLFLGDVATREFTAIPLRTWIDKCTWALDSSLAVCFEPQDFPAGFTYPASDTGELTYRDRLWVIESATATPARIYDVPENIADATQPFLSGENQRLIFLDRQRNSLVSLDMTDKLVPAAAEIEEDTTTTGNTTAP